MSRRRVSAARLLALWILGLAAVSVAMLAWAESRHNTNRPAFVESTRTERALTPVSSTPTRTILAPAHPPGEATMIRAAHSQTGRPLQGVQVFVRGSDANQVLGQTDQTGALWISLAGESGSVERLAAVADGFQPLVTEVQCTGAGDVILELTPGASLRGQVIGAGSAESLQGLEVLVWETRSPPSPDALWERRDELDPAQRNASTDRSGGFSIQGLRPQTQYSLVVAGKGWVTESPVSIFVPEVEETTVVVPVARLVGALVRLAGPEGEPPDPPPGLFCRRGTTWRVPGHSLRTFGDPRTAVMAGLNPALLSHRSDQLLFLYLLGENAGPIDPITVTPSIPGYLSVQTEVRLEPVIDHMPEYVIALQKEPLAGTGSLTVTVSNLASAASGFSSVPLGTLSLRPTAASDGLAGYEFQVVARPGQPQTMEGIPFGSYDVWYRSWSDRYLYPIRAAGPAQLVIGPSPASFDLNLADVGSITLLPVDQQVPYDGPLEVMMHCLELGQEYEVWLSFPQAPYTIDALPDARYEFEVAVPWQIRDQEEVWHGVGNPVVVRAADHHRMTFSIPETPADE